MGSNTIGKLFCLTSFGESHGKYMGGVIDGCPSGLVIDEGFIAEELKRRATGKAFWDSPRKETDKVEFVSGLYEGKSTGAPIAFLIANHNHDPEEYSFLKDIYRPGHADLTYQQKYGIRDHRGGGRASARESVVRVVGGAIAKLLIKKEGMQIMAFTRQIGPVNWMGDMGQVDYDVVRKSPVDCPSEEVTQQMVDHLKEVKIKGDSVGGIITCIVKNVPAGLGGPVYDKLEADLAKAMLSINACKGFEIGSGFKSATQKGSEHNDPILLKGGKIITGSNHAGGVLGGISNGMDVFFSVAFKPVPTLAQPQDTINTQGEKVRYLPKGRHDICVIPRAIPIAEAMTALVMADHLLRYKATH